MLENLKWYFVNIGLKKYAPVVMMSVMASLGALFAAHQGMLAAWGVNYIPSWDPSWLQANPISGPILLIELDTTSTAALAGLVGLITLLARAGEHHTMANVPAAPPPVTSEPTAPKAA